MQQVVFHGRGGQGAASSSALLVVALHYDGKYGQAFPFFGGERRGAPVRAFLRIDERPIINRGPFDKPTCIVVLDTKLPDLVPVAAGLIPGGVAVLNSKKRPEDIDLGVNLSTVGIVNAVEIAESVYGRSAIPTTNMVMLGAFAATTKWVSLESILRANDKKYSGPAASNNAKAVEMGYQATMVSGGLER